MQQKWDSQTNCAIADRQIRLALAMETENARREPKPSMGVLRTSAPKMLVRAKVSYLII